MSPAQDKRREEVFFSNLAQAGEYRPFTEPGSRALLRGCLALASLCPPASVVDLGCASGTFSRLLSEEGFLVTGVDISPAMVELAVNAHPAGKYLVADIECLPFSDGVLDAAFLGGVLHHFSDPTACLREVNRILKPNGKLMAFDPNRLNPFMYLYRDSSSPFHSTKGVTANERPVLARNLARTMTASGFDVSVDYMAGIPYRTVTSKVGRWLLPLYNAIDATLIRSVAPRWSHPFVIIAGVRRDRPGAPPGR